MKNIFYGTAIQGAVNRGERAGLNTELIQFIRTSGFRVITSAGGANAAETARLIEQTFGPAPADTDQRRIFIRDAMISTIESPEIHCCLFEVSIPSTGTGDEIAHAYLRPRMGLPSVPVLALYQKGYWQNDLTTMIRGIDPKAIPHFLLREYANVEEAKTHISDVLKKL